MRVTLALYFLALALARPPVDGRFRLFVDRTLSHFHASGRFASFYTAWFGAPDQAATTFFHWNALPD